MLPLKAIEAAIPLTTLFDSANVMLRPRSNTPLEQLVNATYKAKTAAEVTLDDDTIVAGEHAMEYHTNLQMQMGVITECEHDKVMDAWTGTGIEAVRKHIAIARTVVAPAVKELAERSATRIGELTIEDLTQREIVIEKTNPVLWNDGLFSMTSKFADSSLDDVGFGLKLPLQSPEQIRALLLTGVASLDQDIVVWAASLPDGWLTSLWNQYFTVFDEQVGYPFQKLRLSQALTNPEYNVDVALAIFLLGRKLFDDGPLDDTNMSLEQFNDLVSQYRNQAAGQIERLAEDHERKMKIGYLVKRQYAGRLYVSDVIYNKFIEQGGTNEMLLGNLATDSKLITIEEILAKGAELEKEWSQYSAYAMATNTNLRYTKMKEILMQEFRSQCREVTIANGEDQMIAESNVTRLYDKFANFMDTVTIGDFDNLYELCLRGLCATRFAETDSMELLQDIDVILKNNPKMTAREAATVAETKYVVNWIMSQCEVVSYL